MRQSKKEQAAAPPRINKFAVLAFSDSDSDNESDSESEVVVTTPEPKVAASFTQSREFWSRKAQVKRGSDGWNTIEQKPRPNFISDDDEEKVIRREIEAEAAVNIAGIWAEKIRESLERAESARSTEEASHTVTKSLSNDFISSLDKLSFFRKPVPQAQA